MIKKYLSMISVVLAMGFMFMSPASAMDTEPNLDFTLSYDDPATDLAISINDNQAMELMASNMIIEKPMEKISFVTEHNNVATFSNIKGGGFSLAHGSKAFSY